MKTLLYSLILCLLITGITTARVRYVDKNGGTDQFGHQKYTTIQAGIDAAIDNDTVRIYPGIYPEMINSGKNIIIQGAGLSTIISYDQLDPNGDAAAFVLSSGKLMWVIITSNRHGLKIKNATVTNSVIKDCGNGYGVYADGTNCFIRNCVLTNNYYGCTQNSGANLNVINTISFDNKKEDYFWSNSMYSGAGTIYLKNCSYQGNYYVTGETDCFQENPGLSIDFRISGQSKCLNGGDPNILDLDGTRSDMGYYGGPDAPLLPYMTFPQNYILNPDGTIQFDLQGKVGY